MVTSRADVVNPEASEGLRDSCGNHLRDTRLLAVVKKARRAEVSISDQLVGSTYMQSSAKRYSVVMRLTYMWGMAFTHDMRPCVRW